MTGTDLPAGVTLHPDTSALALPLGPRLVVVRDDTTMGTVQRRRHEGVDHSHRAWGHNCWRASLAGYDGGLGLHRVCHRTRADAVATVLRHGPRV